MPRAPAFHEPLFELAVSEPKILVREEHAEDRILEDLERVVRLGSTDHQQVRALDAMWR
jgi:hypothetical protein